MRYLWLSKVGYNARRHPTPPQAREGAGGQSGGGAGQAHQVTLSQVKQAEQQGGWWRETERQPDRCGEQEQSQQRQEPKGEQEVIAKLSPSLQPQLG